MFFAEAHRLKRRNRRHHLVRLTLAILTVPVVVATEETSRPFPPACATHRSRSARP